MEASGGQDDSGNGSAPSSKIGYGTVSVNHLDSPNTTSATTYKVQGASVNNSSYVRFNADSSGGRAESSITLMEIGA